MVNVSEGQRRQLHPGLVEKIGADVADTLMDYLPHAGWSDLATRTDLEHLGQTLRLEMQAMEARLDSKFTDKINSLTRWFVGTQLVLVVAVIGSITAVAH